MPLSRRKTDAERVWDKIARRGPDDCWLWTGYQSNGYGRVRVQEGRRHTDKRLRTAHRVVYEMLHGPLADGLVVRHRCHVRLCCNPKHLEAGTQADNMRDMHEAGRTAAGSKHPEAKLCEADVVEIRDARKNGVFLKTIALKYGVGTTTIYNIVNRKSWRHVKD